MGSIQDRVALVTGAGQGIGRAIALKLAAEGARVVVNDIDAEAAHETVEAVAKTGAAGVAVVGSVTEEGFAGRFVDTAMQRFGGLDIIVNNAGYTWDAVIQRMTDEQWEAMLAVHVTAPFKILRAAQPLISRMHKAEREAGGRRTRKVVNISSISGLDGNPGQANYSSAKAAVVGLTKTLSKEWGRYDVTVNAVAFGYIQTRLTQARSVADGHISVEGHDIRVGMTDDRVSMLEEAIPMGRAGTPEEAAGAVYLFCSPESDYVSGETLVCGGGYHF
ncbi:SDR family oxidoreductase [Streptosporangium sp. NBC_01810]|uniref:SDR family NAD(P)-dependent oxidoreductase n=1 Tax=Streptosporangium sp. NBC_01810 TaxID=2975951 RepID=UPI002DDB56E0|nr:SDR family oxidoreductase [Streptosporangium sp. NBC_01810]WSA28295.1 SDR family oxidoreductase [Streptosporangium sp. NBC_01810]